MKTPLSWLRPAILVGLFATLAAAGTAADSTVPASPAAGRLSLSPAAGAENVCPDTTLRLVFPSAPTLGKTGRIHVVDTSSGADADVIDLAAPFATKTIGGEPNYRYYPVILSGREVTLYPRNGALGYGRKYAVRFEGDVLPAGTSLPEWSFTTKPAAPRAGTATLVVAADGTGDFCTVQGAIDFVPDGNTTPTTIRLKRGTYTEIVFFTNKHALTIVGDDRKECVIVYRTNDKFNPTNGNPFGTAQPNPAGARVGGNIYHRGVFLAHRVNDLVLANLTLRNSTPQGGSQAEAIILNGTTSARAILKDVDLYSYQDTLQINGQAFLTGCYIEGDVDFMWGTGPCFFENTTCRALRSGAYYTQIRNPGTNHGYVYVGCTFDGIQGIMGNYLSRIGTGRFPHSEVVLLDCTLTTAVSPLAWQFQGGREGNDHDPADVHFWEFNSHSPDGKPIDPTFRLPGSKRLQQPADSATIANYRNATWVLGGEWNPRAAPIFSRASTATTPASAVIRVPPRSHLALLGTSTALTVSAAGDAVTYQWRKDGHDLPGATGPDLRFSPVSWTDAGVYTVVVTAAGASATSDGARLTVVAPQAATAPDLPKIPDAVFDTVAFGARGDGASDNTAALQKAIDTAAAKGGGIVVIPAAAQPYLTGPIILKNQVNLRVDDGATLRLLPYSAEPKPGAYPLAGEDYANCITANGARDIALTGGGTIDGDGEAWWAAFRADKSMPHRPYILRFGKCERVLVAGVTFTRSPMFHAAINADHLTVFGVTVATAEESPNTDGVDPSGSHILIQNCAISCGDDNIAVKAGNAFCSDLTVADCAFGEGHGLSVGGQSTKGLDGMTVKNCSFEGTTSGLRLKADPTQGGEVKNVSYTNLTMDGVRYPFVFYSYYNKVGNPGSISGGNKTTIEKVRTWNATPPNPLDTPTMPSWRNITLSNVLASNTAGYAIIWGLPRAGYFIDGVRLLNVKLSGGPGLELFDATNVVIGGDSDVGKLTVANALAIVRQPQSQNVANGGDATFSIETVGPETSTGGAVSCRWTLDNQPLTDGPRPDGTVVAGAHTPTLALSHIAATSAGKYTATVTANLDAYDSVKKALVPNVAPVTATSATAVLVVAAPGAK